MWKNKKTGERVGRIVEHDNGVVKLDDGSAHNETAFFSDHEEDTGHTDADIPEQGEEAAPATGEETTAGTGE